MQVSKQYIVRRLRTAALAHAQIRGLFASILAAVSQNIARLARFPAPAHTTHCGDYLLAELRKEPGSNLTRFQNVFSSSSYSTPTPGYVNYSPYSDRYLARLSLNVSGLEQTVTFPGSKVM